MASAEPKVTIQKCKLCVCGNVARSYSPGLCFARPPSLPQAGKRVWEFFYPLSAAGEERVDQRSVVGVSKFAALQFPGVILKICLIHIATKLNDITMQWYCII